MSVSLAGRSALVTGGAGGIGSACALALARDGAALTLMGRRTEPLREAARRITDELNIMKDSP